MKDFIADKIKEVEQELNNTVVAMEKVKEQIRVFNAKGVELTAHANMLNGQLKAYREMLGDKDEV